ncbi:MAG: undecaprenyldiphospho-muramoylpentapeptide beta-N-acetylglucosaminyltransferase [Actinomycetaceae bacterium]|nr:undecaprenyldiphospho-muramoylpentapeptide beta-N-acetylglucosaminyltransferase [Actinomycetaceae bacterium]
MAKPVYVVAGGGTAGHVNPMLATASHLGDARVVCVGTASGLEADLVPAAGLELVTIEKIPLPRKPSPKLASLPFAMRREVAKLRHVLRQSEARAACGFGGYASTPLYLAARAEGVPVVIHEQNARPGLANKLGARWADVVALTFASTRLRARRGETHTIGLPLRPAIADLATDMAEGRAMERRRRACQRFGLDPQRPVLVVTGGSLGALTINTAVAEASDRLPAQWQILHICGKGKVEAVEQLRRRASDYVLLDYVTDMEEAFALADLVIARSGAGTVAEVSALGIPAIYIPLAIGNGEQRLNASDVVAAGGALTIANADASAEKLIEVAGRLMSDTDARTRMATRARTCGRLDAAQQLARLIEGVSRS